VLGFECFDLELRVGAVIANRVGGDTHGTIARGREFHYSAMNPVPDSIARVYQIRPVRGEARSEGYLINRALMSYVHLHFASNPALAESFVDACAGSARPGKP
jgi:cobyrinic acid a,c-diamide synthase